VIRPDLALHMLVDDAGQILVEPVLQHRAEHVADHLLERVARSVAAGAEAAASCSAAKAGSAGLRRILADQRRAKIDLGQAHVLDHRLVELEHFRLLGLVLLQQRASWGATTCGAAT
jgi:hypothetical protein